MESIGFFDFSIFNAKGPLWYSELFSGIFIYNPNIVNLFSSNAFQNIFRKLFVFNLKPIWTCIKKTTFKKHRYKNIKH